MTSKSALRWLASFVLLGTIHAGAQSTADRPQSKRSDVPMTRPEECIAVVDGIGRTASFVELPDGSLMISRNAGQYSISRDGGINWSEPTEMRLAGGGKVTGSGGSLVRLSGNGIGFAAMVHKPNPNKEIEEDLYHLAFWRSDDAGKTWQGPVRISEPARGQIGIAALNDTLIRTSSGRLVYPAFSGLRHARDPFLPERPDGWMTREDPRVALLGNQFVWVGIHDWPQDGFSWSYAYYSDDEGRTWKTSRGGEIYVRDDRHRMWEMAVEPTIAEVEPGKILMLVRTNLGRLFKSWSFNNGETWTAPVATQLAAGNAPAQLRKVPGTGDLLVVWNQESEEEIRKGLKRGRLSAAISRTNGAVWEFYQNIESALEGTRVEPGPVFFTVPEGIVPTPTAPAAERAAQYIIELPEGMGRFSYPSVFFHRDRVLIAHSNAFYPKGSTRMTARGRIRVLPLSWLYAGAENVKPTPEFKKRFPINSRQ